MLVFSILYGAVDTLLAQPPGLPATTIRCKNMNVNSSSFQMKMKKCEARYLSTCLFYIGKQKSTQL